MLAKLSSLQIALVLSLGLHAALLTLRLVDPEGFNRVFQVQSLEVVLVNSRSEELPTKAMALAQANLAGGGELEKGRSSSPLPPSPLMEIGESIESQRAEIDQLKEEQQQLLAVVRRELALLTPSGPQIDKGALAAREQVEQRRQLVQLLAEIEKRVSDESARPRKRYVSPATREVVYAKYYDHLRRRVEDRGTRFFPEHEGRKLYGELTMNIHVDLHGQVIETDLVAPSGDRNLDRRAVAIVLAAAPFGEFSSAMRQGAEVLVITSRFRFTREDGLETSLSAPR